MTEVKSIFRQVSFTFVFIAFATILGYATRILLSRVFSIEDYGLFYAVLGAFSFFAIFRSLGTSESLVHFIPKYVAEKNWEKIKFSLKFAFFVQLIFGFLISAVFFMFSDKIATYFFHVPAASVLIKIHAVTFFLIGFVDIILSTFRGFQQPAIASLYDPIRLTLVFALSLFLIKIGQLTVKNMILAWLMGYVALLVIYACLFLKVHKKISVAKTNYFDSVIKEMRRYAFPLVLSIGAELIFSRTNVLLLTFLKGTRDVALYEIAFPASQLILFFVSPIIYVLFPMTSKFFYEKRKNVIKEILQTIYNAGLFLIAPIVLLLIIYPDLVIKLLFSEKYIEAALALRIMTIGSFFLLFSNINLNVLSGVGEIKARKKIMYSVATFNIVMTLLLVMPLGYLGAIISISTSFFLLWWLSYRAFLKELPEFKINIAYLSKIVLSLIIFFVSVVILKNLLQMNLYLEALIISVAGLLIYFAVGIFVLKIINLKLVKHLYDQVKK